MDFSSLMGAGGGGGGGAPVASSASSSIVFPGAAAGASLNTEVLAGLGALVLVLLLGLFLLKK